MPTNAILFDLDGTLIDSRQDLVNAVNHALHAMNFPEKSFQEIVDKIGNGLRRLIQDTFNETDPSVLAQAKTVFETFYEEHCLDNTQLYPQVFTVLPVLKSRFKMGVVTNKPFAFSEKILRNLKIDSFFDVIIGGDSVSHSKPHPAPVLAALEKLQTSPSETLFVGDGPQDIQAGKEAGTKTCLARYGFGLKPGANGIQPDTFIQKFSDIQEIVL